MVGMGAPGMGGMGGNAGLFGGGAAESGGGPKDYGSLFGDTEEDDMGDPLMSALADAGYADISPDKLDQIKKILGDTGGAAGGMAPSGMEPTSSGPEAMNSAP